MYFKICSTCREKFFKKKREGNKRFKIRKLCSLRCRIPWNKGTIGKARANKGSFQKGLIPFNKGKEMSQEIKKKISENRKGKGLNTMTEERRLKISLAQRREKSHLWKGGLTEKNKLIRMSLEYRLWREKVFKRDNWICQSCFKRGGKLHPHHIKPFAKFPELRFEISNGITLCEDCHKLTETYGVNY